MNVNVSYRAIRFLVALIASLFILFHGIPENQLYKAFATPAFYTAYAASFGVTLLLIYMIHKINAWLDVHYSWKEHSKKRSILQLVLGVMVPAVADLILIAIYFKAINQDLTENGFWLNYPLILLFIMVINLVYIANYLWVAAHKQKAIAAEVERPAEKDFATLTINYNGTFINLNLADDVLYFYRLGRNVKVVTVTGMEYSVNLAIGILEERFASVNFCRINRGVIINFKIVQGYTVKKKYTWQATIKPQYLHEIKNPASEYFQVTKENLQSFKQGLTKF